MTGGIFKNVLACILAAAVSAVSLPVYSFAYALKSDGDGVVDFLSESEDEQPSDMFDDIYASWEIESKRELDTKYFKMSDGSTVAAVYPFNVHYEENGKLLDIDNTPTEGKDADGDSAVGNSENAFGIKFAKKSKKNKLYTLSLSDEKIKVAVCGARKVNLKTSEPEYTDEDAMTLDSAVSSFVYENILDGADLEYILAGDTVKENIILQKKVPYNEITYEYKMSEGLSLRLEDSETVSIYNTESGDTLGRICAPEAWDSAGSRNENLEFSLTALGENKYEVTLSWDKAWADSPGRAYPVTIDPVISVSADFYASSTGKNDNITDAYAQEKYPAENRNTEILRVGGGEGERSRSVLKIDIDKYLPDNAQVVSATLNLIPYVWGYGYSPSFECDFASCPVIDVCKMTSGWSEDTFCWNTLWSDNGNAGYGEVSDYVAVENFDVSSAASLPLYTWDITKFVSEWQNDPESNYGVMLKYEDESLDGSMYLASSDWIYSEDYTTVNTRPTIVIAYTDSNGVEDYFPTHSVDCGRAGVAYVNCMTGNLTVINNFVNVGSGNAPVSLSLIYNSNDSDEKYARPLGKGWRLGSSCFVELSSLKDSSGKRYFKYTDADGTVHWFLEDTKNSYTSTDETDSRRKLEYSASDSKFTLTSEGSGDKLIFKKKNNSNFWYLYRAEDAFGNYNEYTYCTESYHMPKTVTSSDGYGIELIYNASNFLTSVELPDGESITLSYNANSSVNKITYPDGKSTSYSYDYYKRLSYVTDTDGYSAVIGYNGAGFPLKVTSVGEAIKDVVSYDRIKLEYGLRQTTLTDITNSRKYLYTFSSAGTLKSVVDVTENESDCRGAYYEYNNNETGQLGKGNLTFASKVQKSGVNFIENHTFEKTDKLHGNFQMWQNDGSSASGVSYFTDKAHTGAHSLRIYKDSHCERALYFYNINLTAGVNYTFSAYVNTAGMNSGTAGGAFLWVGGGDVSWESEYVTDVTASDEWRRISLSFTPTETKSHTVCLCVRGRQGGVCFDDVQLERGDLTETNLIENGDFGYSYGWTYSSGAGRKQNIGFTGIGGYANSGAKTRNHIYQTIKVSGKKGDSYVASALSKASSVPADKCDYSMLVRFKNNGTTVNDVRIKFNTYTDTWQKAAGAAAANGDYTDITVFLLYYNSSGSAIFDNVTLVKDNFGNTFTYDSKGNIISTADLEGKEENTFTYNGKNLLVKETDISGGRVFYTYNTYVTGRLDKVTSSGITASYTYDSKGNALSSVVERATPTAGNSYYIKSVKTGNVVSVRGSGTSSGTNVETAYYEGSAGQRWKLEKDGMSFRLVPECASDKYLCFATNSVTEGVNIQIGTSSNLLRFFEEADGTYKIRVGGDSFPAFYMKNDNGNICLGEGDGEEFLFVLIPANDTSAPSFKTAATYNSTGNVTKTTDTRGKSVTYTYTDNVKGLVENITSANGTVTEYTYNSSDLVSEVSTGNSSAVYTYNTANSLDTVTSPGETVYSFTHDRFQRVTAVKVGTTALTRNTYDSKGLLAKTELANGTVKENTYDRFNRLLTVSVNGTERYRYEYDGEGRTSATYDVLNSRKTSTEYDLLGRAVSTRVYDTLSKKTLSTVKVNYDSKNRVESYTVTAGPESNTTSFLYGTGHVDYNSLKRVTLNGTRYAEYTYDSLNRLIKTERNIGNGIDTDYTYISGSGNGGTTSLVASEETTGYAKRVYTYDNVGNIASISEVTGGVETLKSTYTYDALNQLVREDNVGGETVVYTYDDGGNILTRQKYTYTPKEETPTELLNTVTYGYSSGEWKDLLTEFDGGTLTYDAVGNPLNYRDGMTMTWSDGRRLGSVTASNGETYSYTYNESGIRTKKTVNGGTTEYSLNGTNIISETLSTGEKLYFFYDEKGSPVAFNYYAANSDTKTTYYLVKNIQGDVISLVNSYQQTVAIYTYDTWGKLLSITGTLADTIGEINPYRYRSYLYDTETGFYYLNSRYYDPVTGRFVNADSIISQESISGNNLFAYCLNNPINMVDCTGNWANILFMTNPILGALCTVALYVLIGSTISASVKCHRMSKAEIAQEKTSKYIAERKVKSSENDLIVHLPKDDEGIMYNSEARQQVSKQAKEDLGENTVRTVDDISDEIFAHVFVAECIKPFSWVGSGDWNLYNHLVEPDVNEAENRLFIYGVITEVFS